MCFVTARLTVTWLPVVVVYVSPICKVFILCLAPVRLPFNYAVNIYKYIYIKQQLFYNLLIIREFIFIFLFSGCLYRSVYVYLFTLFKYSIVIL